MTVHMIAAIGREGQLGMADGSLPWGDAFPDDRRRFRDVTEGGIIVVGHRTWPAVSHLQGTAGRLFIVDAADQPAWRMLAALRLLLGSERPIWIAGGAKTYARWNRLIDGERDITILPWSGPADVLIPPECLTH